MHINVTIFVCINIYVNSSFWAEVEKLGFDAFGINVYEWKEKTMDGGGRRCSFMHNMQCYSHKVIFRTQKSCIQIYFILLQLGVYISWYFWIEDVRSALLWGGGIGFKVECNLLSVRSSYLTLFTWFTLSSLSIPFKRAIFILPFGRDFITNTPNQPIEGRKNMTPIKFAIDINTLMPIKGIGRFFRQIFMGHATNHVSKCARCRAVEPNKTP